MFEAGPPTETVVTERNAKHNEARSASGRRAKRVQAVRLDAHTIEAIAHRVAELVGAGRNRDGELLTVGDVAERLGVSRAWVYENADELGVIRLGGGKRARLRFDPEAVRQRLDRAPADRRREPTPTRPKRWLDERDLIPIRGQ